MALVLSATVLLLQAPGAAAQACLGVPAMSGQFTVGAYGDFADRGKAYGVDSRSNLPGRLAMGAHIGIIDLDEADDDITSVGGHLALEAAHRGALTLCPVIGVDHDFWSGTSGGVDFEYSRWAFPVGLAVGSRLGGAGGGATVLPSARVGLIHQRFNGEAQAGPVTLRRDGTRSSAFVDAGATLHLGPVYGRGGVHRIFEDDGETLIRLGLGFVF